MVRFAIVLSAALALTARQTPTAPSRGSVEGTVVDSVTGQPVEGVQVALVSGQPLPEAGVQSVFSQGQKLTQDSQQMTRPIPGLVNGGRTLTPDRVAHGVVTDSRGKFAFTGIAPASWSLAFRKDGYTFKRYGERPDSLTWLPLNVRDDKVDVGVIQISPQPRITGGVVDIDGRPIAGIPVYLLNASPDISVDGEKQYRTVADVVTDADGRYVMDKITSGRFFVVAGSAGRPATVRFAAGATTGVPIPAEAPFAFSFYPGVPSVTLAGQIEVPAGGRLNLADFKVKKAELRAIRGRVIDSSGKPPATVRMSLSTWFPFLRAGRDGGELLQVRYDRSTGAFEATNLIPGNYRVDAILPPNQNVPAQLGFATAGAVSQQSAFQLLELKEADIEGLVLTVPGTGRVTGKVVVADGKPMPVAERGLPIPFQLMLRGLGPLQPAPTVTSVSVSDGTFEVGSSLEGKYRFSLGPLRDNYYVSDALLDGVRITNGILSFSKDATSEVTFTLSQGGEIQGTVVDKKNQPVSQAQGILLPDPLPETIPFSQNLAANASGRFTAAGIPPGNYRIYFWESVEPSQFFDRELLQSSAGQALSVHVEKGPSIVSVPIISR
jgi:hypothetical protein